jgi:hypothetical protein
MRDQSKAYHTAASAFATAAEADAAASIWLINLTPFYFLEIPVRMPITARPGKVFARRLPFLSYMVLHAGY